MEATIEETELVEHNIFTDLNFSHDAKVSTIEGRLHFMKIFETYGYLDSSTSESTFMFPLQIVQN